MTGKSKIRSNIRNQNSRIKKKKSFQNRSIDSIIFSHGLAKRGERSGRAVTPRYEITYLIVVGKRFIEIESDGERSRTYTEYCMVNAPRTGQLRLLRPTWGERRKVNPRGINGKHLVEMQTLRRDGVIEANVARIAFQMVPAIIMRYTIVAL